MKMGIFKKIACLGIFQLNSDYTRNRMKVAVILMMIVTIGLLQVSASETQLKAGVAKVNITDTKSAGLINDSLYIKALVLDNGTTKVVIITVDAVTIGRIGSIGNEYIARVRSQIQKNLNIEAKNILINASHLHGAGYLVCSDVGERTILAVKKAWQHMVPVNIGVGAGYEDRIMENRRLRLKNGKEWTIRHANPLPPDEEVIGVGPVDPEIGILRLDRKNGKTLAVVYNFACHPYQGVPNRGTTADFPGFASKVIEDNLSDGAIALFIQGFGGDITPILYKDVNNPRDAETLGNMLGLSTMQALKKIQSKSTGELRVIDEIINLPRRTDIPQRIASMESEQEKLLQSLRGTSLNVKTFIPLYIKYDLSGEYPSYYSHRYLHDKMIGRKDMEGLDAENRRNMEKYLSNIYAMEKLARIQENMSLLKNSQAENEASRGKMIDVEVQGIRIGNFVLISFPAEVSVQIGLNIKKMSPYEFTFVAGYSDGYIHYAPTAEQFKGEAYEDTNCLLAPEWQKIYEEKVLEILKKL
jgi:hypothetical protein